MRCCSRFAPTQITYAIIQDPSLEEARLALNKAVHKQPGEKSNPRGVLQGSPPEDTDDASGQVTRGPD